MSTDRWMADQNAVYIHTKEGNDDTCYNRDDNWKHYPKIRQPQRHKYYRITLLWGTMSSQIQRQKVEWWLSEVGGWWYGGTIV